MFYPVLNCLESGWRADPSPLLEISWSCWKELESLSRAVLSNSLSWADASFQQQCFWWFAFRSDDNVHAQWHKTLGEIWRVSTNLEPPFVGFSSILAESRWLLSTSPSFFGSSSVMFFFSSILTDRCQSKKSLTWCPRLWYALFIK